MVNKESLHFGFGTASLTCVDDFAPKIGHIPPRNLNQDEQVNKIVEKSKFSLKFILIWASANNGQKDIFLLETYTNMNKCTWLSEKRSSALLFTACFALVIVSANFLDV